MSDKEILGFRPYNSLTYWSKNIDVFLSVVKNITEMHNRFYYKNKEEIIPLMKDLFNINEITYYKELVNNRFEKFIKLNNFLLSDIEKCILKKSYF